MGPSWGGLICMIRSRAGSQIFMAILGSPWGALGNLLGASWGILGASWRPLGDLLEAFGTHWSILEVSWCPLAKHVGTLEALKANMLIFQWFYEVLAGHLPWGNRQTSSDPRHKSLPLGWEED